jgi:hypothetical protein
MKSAIIVTFPGHFLLTKLTIDSLRQHYPEFFNISVVYDDYFLDQWPNYVNDCADYYCIDTDNIIPFSAVDPLIAQCTVGWYRQQFAKCCLDQVLVDDEFFIVDGDIIFDERIEVEHIVPVHEYNLSYFTDNLALTQAVTNCTKFLLDIQFNKFLLDNTYKITSSIPFRIVKKTTLSNLRQLISKTLGKDFVQGLNNFVDNQVLTAYPSNNNQLVMNEWELIESVNLLQNPDVPMVHIGSGYDYFFDTSTVEYGRFRQGYVYDHRLLDLNFFEDIPKDFYSKVQNTKNFLI